MAHDHHHHHAHELALPVKGGSQSRAFMIGIALNAIFIFVEIFYGFIADSSALIADAGHNATDVLSMAFAWTAMWLASKKPKGKYTYGFRRTTILVSLLNAILIFAAVIFIGFEAFEKLKDPSPVQGNTVMLVAGIGILINGGTALLFMKNQKHDLNVKGAFLHMIADALVSAGVLLAGLLIKKTGIYWIDPVVSFIIIIVIVWASWKLFVDSIDLALDAVPAGIDLEKVRSYLLSEEGVTGVHDLHIWAMSTTENALTTHLIVPERNSDEVLKTVRKQLHEKFEITHTTIQIETSFEQTSYHQDCGQHV